jgi:hypothetical protein
VEGYVPDSGPLHHLVDLLGEVPGLDPAPVSLAEDKAVILIRLPAD